MANTSLQKHGISLDVLRDQGHREHVGQSYSFASLVAAGKIDEKTLELVKSAAPHITQAIETTANAALQAQLKMAENQGTSASSLADVLAICARGAESDEVRIHIANKAAEMNRDNNSTVTEMNRDNNTSYKELAAMAAGVATLAFIAWKKMK